MTRHPLYFAATGHLNIPQTSPFTRLKNTLSLVMSNNEDVIENFPLNNLRPVFEVNGFKTLLVVAPPQVVKR